MNQPLRQEAASPNAAVAGAALPARLAYREVSKALVAVFLGFIVFRYLEGGQRMEFLGRIRFELIVGSALAVIGIIAFFKDKQRPVTPPLRWAVLLGAWMFLMVPLSFDVALSWSIFIDRTLKFMMIMIFVGAFVTTPTVLRWFLGAYLLAFAKMVQEGIHGQVTGSLVWENQGVMRLHGPTWSYAHPNSFSGTQLGTLPYLYHLAPLAPKLLRFGIAAQAIGALVIILYCGSRTAYVGFFAWLGIVIARARSSMKALAITAVIAAAAVPFIPDQYFARLNTVFTQQEIEGASIDTRKEILRDAWEIFLKYPIGVGIGAFPTVRQQEFGRSQDTHNLYLEVATNLGFVGFILFIGMAISLLATLFRLSKTLDSQVEAMNGLLSTGPPQTPLEVSADRHRRDLKVMAAAAHATFSFLVIRLVIGFFGHDLYEVYWWFILGVAVALNGMLRIATARTAYFKEQQGLCRTADRQAAGSSADRCLPKGIS